MASTIINTGGMAVLKKKNNKCIHLRSTAPQSVRKNVPLGS